VCGGRAPAACGGDGAEQGDILATSQMGAKSAKEERESTVKKEKIAMVLP
jgi:hypothetical protein